MTNSEQVAIRDRFYSMDMSIETLQTIATMWSTPTEPKGGGKVRGGNRGTEKLLSGQAEQMTLWTTPHGMGNLDATGKQGGGGEFAKEVESWTTPSARDWKSGETMERNARPLNEVVHRFSRRDQPTETNGAESSNDSHNSPRRRLSPIFTAYLMGWPLSALGISDVMETESCHSKRPMRCTGCGTACGQWSKRMREALKELVQ